MQLIQTFQDNLRNFIFDILLPVTDKPYYILRHKMDPTSRQKQYIRLYQNIFMMHATSLMLMIPATIFYFGYRKSARAIPFSPNKKLLRNFAVTASLSITLAIFGYISQYTNQFSNRTRQIENQYGQLIDFIKSKKPIELNIDHIIIEEEPAKNKEL